MQTLASGERVLSLLEEEPQIEEVSGQATAEFADINCENIDFAYEEEQILKYYSISILKKYPVRQPQNLQISIVKTLILLMKKNRF